MLQKVQSTYDAMDTLTDDISNLQNEGLIEGFEPLLICSVYMSNYVGLRPFGSVSAQTPPRRV